MEAAAASSDSDRRAMVGDAVAFSVMVGIGETYVPAFALAVGLGDVTAGLVATLPVLAGAVLQLVTPAGVRRLGSYRRWVVACAALQALVFVPLVAAALLGRISTAWLFAAMAAYWGFGMATSPAWNAWVGALVPQDERPRFFAYRARWAHAALFAGILAGGFSLEAAAGGGARPAAFALPFAAAGLARLVSARFLARQSEPEGLARSHRSVGPAEIVGQLRGTDAGRFLAYLLGMQVAVQIASPYFTPFMLGPLQLSYAAFTVLTGIAFLSRIVVLPTLGRVAQRTGTRRLFRYGALAIVPLPPLWLLSDHLAYLIGLQVLGGAAWAALELATVLVFFEGLAERERASILTGFNLVNTLAMATGALLGGALYQLVGGAWTFVAVFGASSAARLLALWLLRGTPAVPPFRRLPILRTLGVRPGGSAIERPILSTVPGPEETPPTTSAT
jgi:MFS family permease